MNECVNNDNAGFTMLEVVIVIGVIAILAGLIAPLAVNTIKQGRLSACWEELQNIKKAIVGDPALIESGSRSHFGFVGDLGMLPRDNLGALGLGQNNSLGDLLTQNGLTATTTVNDVVWGWRGPYITDSVDSWGRDYLYAIDTVDPLIAATVWSVGPDGTTGTSDDISIIIRTDEAFSSLSGNTLDNNGAATSTSITIYAPNGSGVQTYTYTTTVTTPFFATGGTAFPIGNRKIVFDKGGILYSYIISINNGPITSVNFREP